jgi:hypothetical protein
LGNAHAVVIVKAESRDLHGKQWLSRTARALFHFAGLAAFRQLNKELAC